MGSQLSNELRAGLDTLQHLPGVVIEEGPRWDPECFRWIVVCLVTADVLADGPIAPTTRWFLFVGSDYPYGKIVICPAKDGGVTDTFAHQRYNGMGGEERPWRTGNICTETGAAALRRRGYDVEPGDSESNLAWHLERTQRWLELASRDELNQPGDPYELPDIAFDDTVRVVFSEGTGTHQRWLETGVSRGTAELSPLSTELPAVAITMFFAGTKSSAIAQEWQKPIAGDSRQRVAWIRLAQPPTLYPHRIPITWGELREAVGQRGNSFDEDLKAVIGAATLDRDILLLGFPMPDKIEGPAVRMHWLALAIPAPIKYQQRGFRANSVGRWAEYRSQRIHDQAPLFWLRTENWHRSEIANRGKLNQAASQQRILIIGGGAVGSALSEMLTRAGAHQITVMDCDEMEAGNLVRHTLLLEDIGRRKAGAIVRRLDHAAIHGNITAVDGRFPPTLPEVVEQVRNHDVIVDCTGEDSTIITLSRFEWGGAKLFVSVSLGLYARRLLCFISAGATFPHEEFFERVDPWLRQEVQDFAIDDLPRDGPGCWSPRHPARIDDIWMMSAAALKLIEQSIGSPPETPRLIVFEQEEDCAGDFIGIRMAVENATAEPADVQDG